MIAGDVILTHRKWWIGWIIRKVTNSYWDHAILSLGDDWFIQSNLKGVNFIQSKDIISDHVIYRHKTASDEELNKICEEALTFIGKKYDIKQIVYLFFRYVFRLGRPGAIGDEGNFICSELISKPYHEAGFPIIKYRHYSEIIPKDFTTSKYFKKIDGFIS